MVPMRLLRFLPALILVAIVMPTSASAQQSSATCSTFNGGNEPTTSFRAGDPIVVRGTGFGSSSAVLVSIQQDTTNAALGRASATDLGGFSLPATTIPDTVQSGPAVVRAIDARGSATCSISITGAAATTSGGMRLLYIVWGSALAIFGVFLAVLTYRRWKTQRLRDAVASFGRDDRDEIVPAPLVDDEPSYEEPSYEGRSYDERSYDEPADDEPLVDDDTDDDLYQPEREREPVVASDEPQMLPVGWDNGRLRPKRQSDAISRLRREVQTWKEH